PKRPAILVASYFGHLGPALARLARTGVEGLAVDLVAGSTTGIAGLPELADKLIVAGVVDGRNVWRTDLEQAMSTLATLLGSAAAVAVSSSCSLLHVPYTIDAEPGLDESLRTWLAFGDEKIGEIVTLATALREGRDAVADRLDAARTALQMRATDPRLRNDRVR